MIKNVIFDVGKVLVDYDPRRFMEGLGLGEEEREAVCKAMFEHPLWLEGDAGTYPAEDYLAMFIANDPAHEAAIRKAYNHMGVIIEPFSYVVPWLSELTEKGLDLFVLSNYPEYLHAMTKPRMVFLPYMKDSVFSAMVKMVKPEARIYELLMERNGLVPEECVFIDDRRENVDAAAALGMQAIHFTSYEEARRRLSQLLEEE